MVRLDRYIQHINLVPKRSDAKELILEGNVKINYKIGKPSSKVSDGDILIISLNGYKIKIKANISKQDRVIYVGFDLLDKEKIIYELC